MRLHHVCDLRRTLQFPPESSITSSQIAPIEDELMEGRR